MVRFLFLLALLACAPLAQAAVINYEFKFTPYTGDLKDDHVQSVAGTARLFLNNVPLAEQPVGAESLPVIFDDREISPSVWLPVASLGARLHHGHNTVRIEFEPADAALAYHAQLSWAAVNDQSSETSAGPGQVSATNQSGEGKEDQPAKGKIVLEREFDAPFAADQPWHHYPAPGALGDADKAALLALLKARAEAFKPKFEEVYTILSGMEGIKVGEMRKTRCLDKAYAAGMRVAAPAPGQVEFLPSGGPEVVLKGKGGSLYGIDLDLLRKKIKNEATQFCVGAVLGGVYGDSAAAVRDPVGSWKIVY